MSPEAPGSDEEQRWADAMALLEDSPHPALVQGIRRRRNKFWLFIAVGLLAMMGVAFLIAFVWPGTAHHDPADDSSDPLWAGVINLGGSLIGLVLIVLGIVRLRRAGLWGSRWRSPTSVLTRGQRRDLLRQILGKAPLQPARLPLLRDLAARMSQPNPLFLLWTGAIIQQAASLPPSPSARGVAFMITVALLCLFSGVQTQRQARLARKFLAGHEPPIRRV